MKVEDPEAALHLISEAVKVRLAWEKVLRSRLEKSHRRDFDEDDKRRWRREIDGLGQRLVDYVRSEVGQVLLSNVTRLAINVPVFVVFRVTSNHLAMQSLFTRSTSNCFQYFTNIRL